MLTIEQQSDHRYLSIHKDGEQKTSGGYFLDVCNILAYNTKHGHQMSVDYSQLSTYQTIYQDREQQACLSDYVRRQYRFFYKNV